MPDIDFNDLTAQMRENGMTVDDGSESTRHIGKKSIKTKKHHYT